MADIVTGAPGWDTRAQSASVSGPAAAAPSTSAQPPAETLNRDAASSTSGSTNNSSSQNQQRNRYAKVGRTSRACDACAKVKMRCINPGGEPPCDRCARQGYDCTFVNADARINAKRAKANAKRARIPEEENEPPSSRPRLDSPQAPAVHDGAQLPAFADISQHQLQMPSNSTLDLQTVLGPLAANSWLPTGPVAQDPILSAPPAPPAIPQQSSSALDQRASTSRVTDFLTRHDNAEDVAPTPQSFSSSVSLSSMNASAFSSGSRARKDPSAIRQLSNPLGLLVIASLDVPKKGSNDEAENRAPTSLAREPIAETSREGSGSNSGESVDDDPLVPKPREPYFRPGTTTFTLKRRTTPPAACSILSRSQIEELFDIFYSQFHVHAPITDPEHGSPAEIAGRSHFLFHAILGIALRNWTGPQDVQVKLLKLISSDLRVFPRERTLECVQANLLCATWNPVSPQHMDLDEQFLRVGFALRLAMDLRLHETDSDPPEGVPEWVLRSQRRTWALCFIFDVKLSAHRHRECYTPDTGLEGLANESCADDRRMLSSVEWCRILLEICQQRYRPDRRLSSADVPPNFAELDKCTAIEGKLLMWKDRWTEKFCHSPAGVQALLARTRLYYHYAQLLNYANAMQAISEEQNWHESIYATKYIDAVNRLLYTFVEDFGLHRIAGYLSDLHFTYIAFGCVSLIHSITIGLRRTTHEAASAVRLIKRVADLFETSAGKYGHNLRNQQAFLRAVLNAKLDDNGEPHGQPVPLDSDWSGLNLDEIFFGVPALSAYDPFSFMLTGNHESVSSLGTS